ncbi:Dolichyl-diphosphooligosaccharide-protein glycosyltransferase [Heliocybe sulcata]|uniref:Dolichyl-diphosphooligosaccharide--protein glycosyltransferase subunit WBP1 n=1 Tax=Heliocybe sulcata TaxID=5364 RepID=A0A5C3MPP2_9AGAM|nr:Dolichyl-diphosphooligosaccharide-protein glycosyltransferase [Heliocybe sulcata]
MFRIWRVLLLVLSLAILSYARSSTGSSVLVVLDPSLSKDNYSIFFKGLEEQGYELTFRAPKDVAPAIIQDGIASFAHVILFTPETKTYAKDITPQSLVDLLSQNTNVILALGSKQTPLTSLASEFSLILPPPGTPLISHFPERDTPATVIPIPVSSSSPALTSGLAPVWYSGIPFALGNNPLLVPFLNAPAESFAADTTEDSGADALVDAAEKGGEGLWAGKDMSVVTGFQTVDGGRVLFVGGVELFNDEFAKKEVTKGVRSGNAQFAREMAAWTFQESLVLRIDDSAHHKVNETEPRDKYTTNDRIVYTTHISKYNPATNAWEPFSGLTDVQLEFTMLDPHIRTALPPVPSKPGEYSVTFRVPDRHGVFKFVVDYKRKGWTHLHSSTTVPVVPPRHDEYPRFLSAAWPYYVGAISTSAGFVLFSVLWLAGDDRDQRKKKGVKAE